MKASVDIRIHFPMEEGESLDDALARLEGNLKSIGIEYDEFDAMIEKGD